MSEQKYKTIIDLADSTNARCFKKEEMIHKDEYERILKLIDAQLEKIPSRLDNFIHYHNTISVLGDRGTGKTSFLHSVVECLKGGNYSKQVQILGFIDPTSIEEKEHIFLQVISLMNQLIEEKLNQEECKIHTMSYEYKRQWKNQLMKMAKGLPALDKVGESRQTSKWQSHEFIMEEGLSIVHAAYSLETEFRGLVNLALNILGRKCFVLVLDDIDVDMKKGWDILEMLRKYITTPQIITILSGNLKLYSLNVRKHQWDQLEANRKFDSEIDYTKIVNELEGQYLLKVLKSENRIHLKSILEYIELQEAQFEIRIDSEHRKDIIETYRDIFSKMGIKNSVNQDVFINYMLGISVRSQIQFLLNNAQSEEHQLERTGMDYVESFLSRLYAANIDVELAVDNAQMLAIIIQQYLEKQKAVTDLYQLIPNVFHKDVNACLLALTILFSREAKHSNFLIFDYMVRIGYVRNLLLGFDGYNTQDDFYKHLGLNQIMSLKDNVGLSIGYCLAYESQLSSHIALFAFAEKSKKGGSEKEGRFDYEVKQKGNRAQNLISYLPISIVKYATKNESRVFYSFYSLLAVIAEVLKTPRNSNQKAALKSLLMNLESLRTYPTWTRNSDKQAQYIEMEENIAVEDEEIVQDEWEKDDNTLEVLVDKIAAWSENYSENIPPYLLGKIVTRLYYTLQKIQQDCLGEQMHRTVIAFLNACLVEECLEHNDNSTQSIDKLNRSNAITQDNLFLNNITSNTTQDIHLTKWMMRCPLIRAFVNPEVLKHYEEIEPYNEKTEPYNVYKLLTQVKVKDTNGKTTSKSSV